MGAIGSRTVVKVPAMARTTARYMRGGFPPFKEVELVPDPDTSLVEMPASGPALLPVTSSGPPERPSATLKMAVVGAMHPAARAMCLNLKSNPMIKEMSLADESTAVHALGTDLSAIAASCKVTTYAGMDYMNFALKGANVVVVSGGVARQPKEPCSSVFEQNMDYVMNVADVCATACRDAVFVVMTEPVNSMVPLFLQMLKTSQMNCPERVIGLMSLDVLRSRVIVGRKLGLDPGQLKLHVIGGASPQTMVPVLSNLGTVGEYLAANPGMASKLTARMKSTHQDVLTKLKGDFPGLSAGYAASRFMETLIKAMSGWPTCLVSGYVRSSLMEGVKYLATPLRLGPRGVQLNHGVPVLSEYEMSLLESALMELEEDAGRGERAVESLPAKTVAEVIGQAEASKKVALSATAARCL